MEERNTTIRTVVLAMGYTYSQSLVVVFISGVLFVLITHCMILLLTGKAKQIKALTVIVTLIFIARYAFMTLG